MEREADDRAIVRRVLSGDREAFRVLVERRQSSVFHCARRIVHDPEEAEDIAQDTFVRAYTSLGEYDERWAFATWLLTIATRLALNAIRRRRLRTGGSVEDLPAGTEIADAAEGPRDRAARNEWTARLGAEIEALSEKMRLVFTLRHEHDFSVAQIARATESTESAVKVTLHRARKILNERLREFSDFA